LEPRAQSPRPPCCNSRTTHTRARTPRSPSHARAPHPAPGAAQKLRSQLAATSEWSDPEARAALASRCGAAAAGGAALAALLRTKDCSALRKRHLLCLARAWGYKSDLWRPKRDRKADNRATAAVCTMTDFATLTAALTADALTAHVAGVLRPLRDEAARVHAGPRARALALNLALSGAASSDASAAIAAAAAVISAPHVTDAYVANTRATARVAAWVAAQMRLELGTLVTWRAELARLGPDEASQAAWKALSGEPSPAERVFRALSLTLAVASSHTRAVAQRAVAHHGGLDTFEAANVDELHAGVAASLEFVGRAEALLAQLRFGRFELFLHASGALVAEAVAYAVGMSTATDARAEWLAEAVARRRAAQAAHQQGLQAAPEMDVPCFADMLAARAPFSAQVGAGGGAAGNGGGVSHAAAAAAAAEAAAIAALRAGAAGGAQQQMAHMHAPLGGGGVSAGA
jgi:hypothetical protein